MENFIRIAFWITLSGYLQTESQPIVNDFSENFMRKHVKCESESTFFAPTSVESQCITTALDCVKRELIGTAKKECEDPAGYINLALEVLDLQIKNRADMGYALTNSTECACERWRQTPFKEFLENAVSLLQLVKSESSENHRL